MPYSFKRFTKWLLIGEDFYLSRWRSENPFSGTSAEWENSTGSQRKLGIIFDFAQEHRHYIAACLELNVSYKVVEIHAQNWMNLLEAAGCDAFLVWPSIHSVSWKRLFDDRLRIMVEDLNLMIYPSLKETWLYESKLRTADWLSAHQIPHPQTWIFYSRDEALAFADQAQLPVVIKSDLGASSHGVMICRRRSQMVNVVNRYFNHGVTVDGLNKWDRQRGYIIFQEYLPDVNEWRMVRIGNSFLCRFKGKIGDFHSGSGNHRWGKPDRELLDMTRRITDQAGFTSMNLDIFQTREGRLLVNELHTVFGAIKPITYLKDLSMPPENMGRYLYVAPTDEWIFEPGDFYKNACANLRVEHLLALLENPVEPNS